MNGLMMKYFVLKPKSKRKNDLYAKASRKAMQAYAKVIEKDNPVFSKELLEWVSIEEGAAADLHFREVK